LHRRFSSKKKRNRIPRLSLPLQSERRKFPQAGQQQQHAVFIADSFISLDDDRLLTSARRSNHDAHPPRDVLCDDGAESQRRGRRV
jgi:hypothetical protein